MKILPLPILSLALFLLASCSGDDPAATTAPTQNSPGRNYDDQIQLRYGRAAAVGESGTKIVFAAIEEDSRCPANVQCPWMGNGRIRLDVIDSRGQITPLQLNTSREPRGSVAHGLRIDLMELRPYPAAPGSLPADVYWVVLAVEER